MDRRRAGSERGSLRGGPSRYGGVDVPVGLLTGGEREEGVVTRSG